MFLSVDVQGSLRFALGAALDSAPYAFRNSSLEKFGQDSVHVDGRERTMGRCNGGGGARHGGGGYQDGQAKGTKAGKRGHGKSGQHDATASTREVQKRDKFGKPLNHGPYQNGYHVGGSKQAAQGVNVQADNVAELGALLGI